MAWRFAAPGAFAQVGAVLLDLADVGFAFVGVGGEGEHGDARGGRVQDEHDRLGFSVVAGQGGDPGPVGLGPGQLRYRAAMPGPGVSASQHGVGAIDLVASGGCRACAGGGAGL